ncbi:PLDc N-terminal domain-containing protein [Desulfovermiculus halophilus]|jgi:hypothetical protein|uniref:PLDc N-terminal domain-containing protein n=1 Tax=Desulfovermiculus halophilus TaxID=339722 RepID=UPI0004857824|nr:PLDc N-terminal domain-containing protein [Desulfovermiculus halophilus]
MPELSTPILVLIALAFILPIAPNLWAIWHIFHCEYPSYAEKMGWLVAAMFLPVLGGVAYCVWGRKRGIKTL